MSDNTILEIQNLKVHFFGNQGAFPAVDGIDLSLSKQETLGVVGESGCGKSVTALSILGLVPSPPGKIIDGKIFFENRDLLTLKEEDLRRIRGNKISMIFQEPMTSLNPVYTVGRQIQETLKLHQGLSRKEAEEKTVEMIRLVKISRPENCMKEYPHQLSGGMRQRIMIAMALSCNPQILLADEPTTALDVTIQAQILELMIDLQREFGTSIIMISHNLGVIAKMARNVIVMYAGKIVEYTDVKTIFKTPRHPYTVGLLNSIPTLDTSAHRLQTIKGTVPGPDNIPKGCLFHPRCPDAMPVCIAKAPEFAFLHNNTRVRCWKYIDR